MSKVFDGSKQNGARSPLDDPHILSGPFWGELRVFLAVAKAKSFNRAAEELNMSQPTVSRQVRRLQDVIGALLVIPTQSGIQLTRQGEELAKSLLDLDQKLFEISNDLSAEARAAEGRVRLTAGEALAGLFLAPSMVSFSERYPKIHIDLSRPTSILNFRENQCDVMLGHAPSQQPGVSSCALGFVHFLPMATRQYCERFGIPTRSNLSSHYFLQCSYYNAADGIWGDWHAAMSRGVVAHTCDNSFTYALMAKSGLGIGLLASYALTDAAALPLDLDVHVRVPIYATALTENLAIKPVRLVFDWISEVFAPTNPWFAPDLKLDLLPKNALMETASHLMNGPAPRP